MKRKLVSVLLVTAVVLTGCSSGTSNSTETGVKEEDKKIVKLDDSVDNTTDKENIKFGGNIVIAESADPQNVNPLFVVDQTSFDMQQALYSPFFEIVSGELYYGNGLAESIEVNEDASEYTMKLREGLKWHDGEAITADDVVFTMDVVIDPDQNVPYSSYGYISNEPVQTVKVDDLTVKFVLPSSSAGFLGGLSQIYCIPQHIYEGVTNIGDSELNQNPVGSGPFKFEEYKSGEYFKVAKFDDWFDDVYLDRITFQIVKDANSANAALASGDINARLISANEYSTVKQNDDVTIYSYNSGRVNAMFFNQNNQAMQDENVRMAIAYALDKDELINYAYTSSDFAEAAYSVLTPDTLYYNDSLTQYNNDQEKAKELLEKSSQKNLELNLLYISTNKTMESEALYIQSKLAEIGITITLNPMDESSFKNKIQETDTTDYDLVLTFYTLGEEPSLYADMASTGSRSNYSHISDSELDNLWTSGNNIADETQRADTYKQIQSIINDNMYIYPISYSNGFYAVNDEFGGFDQSILKTIYYDYSKIYVKE